jgi:hypothetical protein
MVAFLDIKHFKQKGRLISNMVHQGRVQITRATILAGNVEQVEDRYFIVHPVQEYPHESFVSMRRRLEKIQSTSLHDSVSFYRDSKGTSHCS